MWKTRTKEEWDEEVVSAAEERVCALQRGHERQLAKVKQAFAEERAKLEAHAVATREAGLRAGLASSKEEIATLQEALADVQANVHEASKKARETAESAARQRLERALSTLTRQLETKAMLTANQALEEWQAEVGALQQEGAKLVSTHTKELAALREEHAESQQSLQSESKLNRSERPCER